MFIECQDAKISNNSFSISVCTALKNKMIIDEWMDD